VHIRVALLLVVLMSDSAPAQQMYKCGSTYSQVPCDAAAQPTRIYKDTQPNPPAGLRGRELCRYLTPRAANLKDPFSAVVEQVAGPVGAVVRIGSDVIEAKRFDVMLNAKNSYGAYVGARPYGCFLSVDERRLLHLQSPED
jgi:hypothetical protein